MSQHRCYLYTNAFSLWQFTIIDMTIIWMALLSDLGVSYYQECISESMQVHAYSCIADMNDITVDLPSIQVKYEVLGMKNIIEMHSYIYALPNN